MRLPSQFGASLKRLGQHLRTKQSVVFLAVAIYGTTFSFLTIARMYALKSNAWDLGNYNQAIYSFSCCGRPFYWTSDILNNPSGGLFGIHFSPIFFLFVPLYLI